MVAVILQSRTDIIITHQPALTVLATRSIRLRPWRIVDGSPPRRHQVAGPAR